MEAVISVNSDLVIYPRWWEWDFGKVKAAVIKCKYKQ